MSAGAAPEIKQKTSKELRSDTQLVNLFRSAIEAASDENGWAYLSGVGTNIIKQATDFDPRNYGYKKLSELAGAIGLFEITRVDKRILIKYGRAKKREPVE